MNIALIGRGKTGREIESAALLRGHTIAGCFTSHNPLTDQSLERLGAPRVDCVIDFSTASAVAANARICLQHHIPIVVGTTGWHAQLPEVRALVEAHEGALVYASNFSLGVQIYLKVIAEAARLFNAHQVYDVSIHEIHHRLKRDAPSGTARTIAQRLIETLERKRTMRTDPPTIESPLAPDELSVSSTRVGSVFGTHCVTFSSDSDEIELTHRAHSRTGFAIGALMAAEWVQNRRGVFTAEDVFFG